MRSQDQYDAVARAIEWPMTVLSLLFAVVLVVDSTVRLPPTYLMAGTAIEWAVWAAFVCEYVLLLYLAPRRLQFVRTHVLDLVVVAFPALRIFRALRVLRVLRAVRVARVATFLGRAVTGVRTALGRTGVRTVFAVALLVTVGGAALVMVAEGPEKANFASYGNALWWACVTVTTVGYGDMAPATPMGRIVAVILMLVGVAIFGAVSAALAAHFVDQDNADERERLAMIEEKVGTLERMLADVHASVCGGSSDR
jgi:voltage-gated potassium channel